MDICQAAKQGGKYLPLFTDTKVNNNNINIVLAYNKPVDSQPKIVTLFLTNG